MLEKTAKWVDSHRWSYGLFMLFVCGLTYLDKLSSSQMTEWYYHILWMLLSMPVVLITVISTHLTVLSYNESNETTRLVTLLDRKVFGSLYTIEDTISSMMTFLSQASNSQQRTQRDNLFIMAYWLWFGIDEQWKKEDDITCVNSKFYSEIVTRLHDTGRSDDSETLIIVFDPDNSKSELLAMIKGIIRNKAKSSGWKIGDTGKRAKSSGGKSSYAGKSADDKIDEYANNIYEKYKSDIEHLRRQIADRGRSEKERIFYSRKIPNIIFAQEIGTTYNGISFLGEIDFLQNSFKGVEDELKRYSSENGCVSEFFGFETHDPQMVKSLIKQVLIQKSHSEPSP